MDCCNYMEYRGHQHYSQLYHHHNTYAPHGYHLPYNQQPACFQSEEPSNYHTGYVYTPKEARIQKALRAEIRDLKGVNPRGHKPTSLAGTISSRQGSQHQQWGNKVHHQPFQPGVTVKQARSRHNPVSSRMLVEQERSLQVATKGIQEQAEQNMIQGCTDSYLDVDTNPYHQSTNHVNTPRNGDYVVLTEMDGQQWLPYVQMPQSGTSYMPRPNDETKIQQGSPWAHHATEIRQHQVSPYSVRQQMMNGSYGNCMQAQPLTGTSDSGEPTAAGQMINHSDRDVGSSGDGTVNNIQQHHYLYQQQQPADSSGLPQNMVTREEVNREEQMQMLEMIPMSLANSVAPISIATTSAAATTAATQKAQIPSISYSAGNNWKRPSATSVNKSSKNSSSASTHPAAVEITSTLSDNSGVANGTENTNGPLPAFEQAFGSTEIGRYSHEGFFSNTTQQTENHQPASNEVSINSAPDYNYYMGPLQIPTFESTMHYHQNQLQAVNQYSGFYNYYNYNYNCNEFHQHFSYSHNQFSHYNPLTNAPMKYENVLNY
ncbi:uncharacterized protein LOC117282450 [Cryptotermes secundus]|uniref:uncharacterized protein LOC117282450 n=1 Tax=Cryptotermes secundus TaxID=105785 RepID=UPI001454C714|nr:uncharacterized protein LOC117282450 [Cryptotermes secundus]